MSKCSYCGSDQYGHNCLNAPDRGAIGFGTHCHKGGPGCIWCGSDQHGKNCLNAPDRGAIGFGTHEHSS